MSENISQLFKDWMIATGKSKNTASSYYSGVNAVSNHCGRDVFEIDDLDELERLYRLYGPKGEHAEIGASNSGNVQSGLKQWLEYQRHLQAENEPSIDPVEGRKQWDAFLARWPLEQLRALTLEHYYGAEGDDSFYSWLRNHTSKLGVFKEGILSAGVRLRGANASAEVGTGMQSDGRHIWYSILGNNAREAFEHLKRELLTAVEAVRSGDMSSIAGLKNAPGSLVWKVAFLYQDQSRPLVLPFYTLKRLKWVAGPDATGNALAIQQRLMSRRGEQELLAFAAELERQAMKAHTIKEQKDSPVMVNSSVALNQILFGPPGTGKTYATIDAALEVLDAEFLAGNRDNRVALKARFDELAAAGLVRFVTFHQSFSYEDFVEGLRAENAEDGSLRYVVADGVFKSLCEAAAARVTQQADAPIDLSGRRIWKMSLGNSLGSDAYIYDECIEKGYALLGYGGLTDFSGCKSRDEVYQRFVAAGDEVARDSYAVTSVTTFLTKVRKGDLLVVTEGNTKFRALGEVTGDYACINRDEAGDDYGQSRAVKWLRVYSPSLPHDQLMNNQFSQMTLYELKSGALDMAKLAALLRVQRPDAQGVRQPRVLIIDEINRGNVSRIFGELITLIEPTKRAGATEALDVMLPYSKQPFSVPDNVYLIGTMNTADRSLAGLDIALRRRFVFREMPARPELLDAVTVEGIAIGELLRVMNARIEVLLDRDHCLGHAYFMPLAAPGGNTLEALAMIFRQQILPLLQEYFFEDWQRIQWVLNDHRKAQENSFVYQASRDAQSLFGEGVNVAAHNLPWAINEDAFDRAEAYLGIINHELVVTGAQPSREVSYPPYVIRQLPTGTIEVIRSGQAQSPVKPVLREIAGQLKVSHWHDNGVQLTTRQLGRKLIAAIEANA